MLFFRGNTNTQNAIAKLKYEDAEGAYEKADFPSVIKNLDEVERLLGKTNTEIYEISIPISKNGIALTYALKKLKINQAHTFSAS